ncbi:hypothetical protein AB4254_11290 [Vibrio breoganii]
MKLNLKFKPLVICLSIASGTANATVPMTDISALVESINSNINRIEEYISDVGISMIGVESDASNNQNTVSMQMNMKQIELKKLMEQAEDLYNNNVEKEHEPMDESADSCAVSSTSAANDCYQADVKAEKIDIKTAELSNFKQTPVEQYEASHTARETFIDDCRSLTYAAVPDDVDRMSASYCLRGGILLGAETGDTYTAEEQNASDLMIKAITGVGSEYKPSQSYTEGTFEHANALTAEVKESVLRSIVFSSLTEVDALRSSAHETPSAMAPSSLGLLQAYDDSRWGSESWKIKTGGNTQNPDDSLNIHQVQRAIAEMQAFQIHLELLKYKQSLRMEVLKAAQLQLEIDKRY